MKTNKKNGELPTKGIPRLGDQHGVSPVSLKPIVKDIPLYYNLMISRALALDILNTFVEQSNGEEDVP